MKAMKLLDDREEALARRLAPRRGWEAARVEARSRMWFGLGALAAFVSFGLAVWHQSGGQPLLLVLLAGTITAAVLAWAKGLTVARHADAIREAQGKEAQVQSGSPSRRRLPPRAAEIASLIGEEAARDANMAHGLALMMGYFLVVFVLVTLLLLATAPSSTVLPAMAFVVLLVEAPLAILRIRFERRGSQRADAYLSAQLGARCTQAVAAVGRRSGKRPSRRSRRPLVEFDGVRNRRRFSVAIVLPAQGIFDSGRRAPHPPRSRLSWSNPVHGRQRMTPVNRGHDFCEAASRKPCPGNPRRA